MTKPADMLRLGVNIDHVATLRNARGGSHPCPVSAALLAQKSGADGITAHLREDRRHIKDDDIVNLKQVLDIPLNFEMAATEEMVSLAERLRPNAACIVPEKRAELTTEGGLAVTGHEARLALNYFLIELSGCTRRKRIIGSNSHSTVFNSNTYRSIRYFLGELFLYLFKCCVGGRLPCANVIS